MENIKLDSSEVGLARELLKLMYEKLSTITVQYLDNECLGFQKFNGNVIENLIQTGLIISYDIHQFTVDNEVYFIKLTELGSVLAQCQTLAELWNNGISDEADFVAQGSNIYTILKRYDENEIDPLVKLLTAEEQDAYQHYYKTQIWALQTVKNATYEDTTDNNVLDITLAPMFELSVELGTNGENQFRTNDYVFKKCMEELGEMALEDQIELGLSYKDAGDDGVAGEAVDLAICAMDMFALQFPGSSAKEIEIEFIKYMNKKLQKWRTIVGK